MTTTEKTRVHADTLIDRIIAADLDALRERVEKLEAPTQGMHAESVPVVIRQLMDRIDELEKELAAVRKERDDTFHDLETARRDRLQISALLSQALMQVTNLEKERDALKTELDQIRETLIKAGVRDTSEDADGNYVRSTLDMVCSFVHAQLVAVRQQTTPSLEPLFATAHPNWRHEPHPTGDWTEGGKWRAITAEERNCLPKGAEVWRVDLSEWMPSGITGERASLWHLYRVPNKTEGGAS